MIEGEVSAEKKAVIPLHLFTPDGSIENIDVVIDTGFTGYLTLPSEHIRSLQIPLWGKSEFILGDGHQVEFRIFTITISWEDQEREISVLETESEPLIGMSLITGSRVTLDVVDGGRVTILPLP